MLSEKPLLNPSHYKLGQVGGFPLRLSWLPRAYTRYVNKKVLPRNPEEMSCDLGIGKNMVKSLRIWGQASGIFDEEGRFSNLANRLFRRDPFFESIDSIVLIHWLICSNQQCSTANSWLFNHFHVGQFTVKQAVSQFRDFLATTNKQYAVGTIRVDVETALRMYTSLQNRAALDLDDKFLHPLGLLTVRRANGKSLFSRTWETERPLVSSRVMAYAVLSSLAKKKTNKSTLSDLYSSSTDHPAPGVIFGFTKGGFYSATEKMVQQEGNNFAMASLPGGDFQLTVKSNLSSHCQKGNFEIAEQHCFPEKTDG